MRPTSTIPKCVHSLLGDPESGYYQPIYDSAHFDLRKVLDNDRAHLWDFCGMGPSERSSIAHSAQLVNCLTSGRY